MEHFSNPGHGSERQRLETTLADGLPSSARQARITEVIESTLVTVPPDMGLPELLKLLVNRRVGGAPVAGSDGKPLGFVSKTDVLRDLVDNPNTSLREQLDVEFIDTDTGDDIGPSRPARRVADIMSTATIAVPQDASIADAAAVMARDKVHRVLVVDVEGRIIGIASAIDIVRWLART